MPVNTGGTEKDALRCFCNDELIPSGPDDLEMLPVNRGQLVDELRLSFTHTKPMPCVLPNVTPTLRKIVVDGVVVAQFRGDKLACERIYSNHANVLRQVGLLNA